MTKLSQEPFQKRIRIKYLLLGIMIGGFMITFAMSVGNGIAYALTLVLPEYFNKTGVFDVMQNQITGNAMLAIMFCSLILLFYYDKTKSKSVEGEKIGIKYDWDDVTKV